MTLTLDSGWLELYDTIAWRVEGQPQEITPVPMFYPIHDNNFLYLAYLLRLYRPTLTEVQKQFIREAVCHWGIQFFRFQKTDLISHDEALGIAYILFYLGEQVDRETAAMFLRHLRELGGMVPEEGHPWPDILRIPGVEACLGVAAGEKPSTIPQIIFMGSAIVSGFASRGHASPFLRKWVSAPMLINYPIASLGLLVFNLTMAVRKYTLVEAFTQYFSKVPQLAARSHGKGWLDP